MKGNNETKALSAKDLGRLEETVRFLEKLADKESDCFLTADNGFDESMLLGSDDSFLSLAKELIQFVCVAHRQIESRDYEFQSFASEKVWATDRIKYCFSENGDAWPVSAFLAKDDEAVLRLIEKM